MRGDLFPTEYSLPWTALSRVNALSAVDPPIGQRRCGHGEPRGWVRNRSGFLRQRILGTGWGALPLPHIAQVQQDNSSDSPN